MLRAHTGLAYNCIAEFGRLKLKLFFDLINRKWKNYSSDSDQLKFIE